ncbi:phage/plasmid primase, P4 family [Micavibrio aeruginosavorus]|uniref:Phage/plasmid primase, P4 family, C-terminal domain protein n=1 Tax=Micavibrio aeruginosavorus (strain ARL-13) TaxID=856793 RepID=G2KQ83_MICAA|nr:phage/plasmid primase, P4 family [Micavibrio aeruginosavorus]AEP08625.1 phage/plasmid primase, P4 family, C-terminal domain protein [Micavibrio aeruginosavorus ARL-13]
MTKTSIPTKFLGTFTAYDRAYGQCTYKGDASAPETKKATNTKTVRKPITPEAIQRHLDGSTGIGLIPLLGDNTCAWAAIDIDLYVKFDHAALERDIAKMGLPLTICRSKSGGAHLYMFFTRPYPADQVQTAMRQCAMLLGYSDAEIFPKQTHRKNPGDVGNFINMPYFNAAQTDRYAIENGQPVDLERFLALAEARRTDLDTLREVIAHNGIGPKPTKPKKAEPQWKDEIAEGNRHNELLRRGTSLRRQGYGMDTVEKILTHAAETLCTPPMDQQEVQQILKWIDEKVKPQDTSYPLTDQGNGYRFRDRYEGHVICAFPGEHFYIWDKTRYKRDETDMIITLAKETALSLTSEIQAAIAEGKNASGLRKHMRNLQSRGGLNNMVWASKSELRIHQNDLDRDVMLLNVQNGTIDLKTGNLLPHNPAHLITKMAPVTFDPQAECPEFMKFLHSTFDGKADMIAYIQRVFGYCLTGLTVEHCFFIMEGRGRNGKSTLLTILAELMGDYHRKSEAKSFLTQRNEGVRNDIAGLKGVRVVTASEIAEGIRMNEPLIKEMTGGDIIAARFLYQEYFEFRPQCKIIMAVNVKPEIIGTDVGIWERIRLIPFEVTIPEHKRDKNLMGKLQNEKSGILNWALEGLKQWHAGGLQEPPTIKAALEKYRGDMDVVGRFLAECTTSSQNDSVSAHELYETWRVWQKNAGEPFMTQRTFGLKLTEKRILRVKERYNGAPMTVYKGLRITHRPKPQHTAPTKEVAF